MKWNALLLLISLPFLSSGIELKLATASFLDGNMEPFIEVQYQIPSESIKFGKNDEGKWQGAVKMQVVVSQDADLLLNTTYDLFSQEVEDLNIRFDLTDFKRVPVKSGVIKIQIQATDYMTGEKAFAQDELLFKKPHLNSELCFVEDVFELEEPVLVSHGNILLLPRVEARYGDETKDIWVYLETYKSGEYQISVNDTNKILQYRQLIKHEQEKIKQHVIKLPRLQVGSGNLRVTLEKQSTQEILAENWMWVNKASDEERFMSLLKYRMQEYIEWVKPLAHVSEEEKLLDAFEEDDSMSVKKEFYQFWTANNSDQPWLAWLAYQKEVALVNERFKMGNMPGYRTDRGRVYLQYGKPFDVIEVNNTAATYDYEIWQYPNDGKTGDATFYFVNYSFTQNNFVLVHSTSLGEPQNPNWKETIKRGNQRSGNEDGMGSQWEREFMNK